MLQCGSHLTVRMFCMIIMVNSLCIKAQPSAASFWPLISILFQIQFIMGDILTGLSQAGAIYSGIASASMTAPCSMIRCASASSGPSASACCRLFGYYCCRHAILGCFTNLHSVIATAQQLRFVHSLLPAYQRAWHRLLRRLQWCALHQAYLHLHAADRRLLPYRLLTLIPLYGNIGLWLAFLIFYIARSSFLLFFVPKLQQRVALV